MAGKTLNFIVSDESNLNYLGSRILTAGIDIKQYKRNPIVLWYHHRPGRYNSTQHKDFEALPIGKAIKLWKEDGKLMVEVEFDQEDDFAKKIEGKVERGYLNMCSPALEPVTISEDKKYLLEGQTRATVVKSILEEISIVDIGGNNNALRLSHDPSQKIEDIVPLLQLSKTDNKMNEFKQQVATILGLDPNAADESVLASLNGKIALAKEADGYKVKHDALKTQVDTMAESRILALVDENQDKKFTADKRETFIQLGKSAGFETLKNVLDATPVMVKPGEFINRGGEQTQATGSEKMTFAKLREGGLPALEKYKTEQRQDYIRLYKAEYNCEPTFEN